MSNNTTKVPNIPELRFPEFRYAPAWEEKAIGSICKTFSGGTPTTTQKEFYGGDIPFIRSAEISKDRTELFLTKEGLKNSAAKLVNIGDVLVALYGANSGDVSLAKVDGAINQAILCLRSEASNPFIFQFLSYKKTWLVSTYIQGGQGNLSGEIIKSVKLYYPYLPEQQKIADCLTAIDELITAQTQKLEALKSHKQGLMQQLFPAEGQTVPKLRFPEFRNAPAWEERPLRKICHMQAGKFVSASEISEREGFGLNPCYGGNGLRGFTKSYTHIGKCPLIGRQGALCGNVTFADGKFHATEHAIVATPKKNVNVDWLYYKLIRLNLNQFATGQAQPGLSVDNLEKIVAKLPVIEKEQQKIADCLTSIDERITAQTQKLEALKSHKQGLMQQLFPSPGNQ